jgi:hypothetical protein
MRWAFVAVTVCAITAVHIGCEHVSDLWAGWSKQQIDESKRRGNDIIAALEAYKKEQSAYPERLDMLVPKYLPKIEPPVVGGPVWHYETWDHYAQFDIWFGNIDVRVSEPVYKYSSESRIWSYNSK